MRSPLYSTERAALAGTPPDIATGARGADSTWASFDDGHYEMKFCDAVIKSAREGRWIELDEI